MAGGALPELSAHIEARYGVAVAAVAPLDVGVYRIGRRDGPDWVARVFPDSARPAVDAQARLLGQLETGGFPAERCAAPEPVRASPIGTVLVTGWVEGVHADARGRTYGILGALLGRLHALPGESLPAGGAWHHLSLEGGPRAEIDAALALLDANPARSRSFGEIRAAVAGLDDCSDLPHGIVHPDFVPVNAITTPDDGRVIVDWAGAGRGPRLYSLAFMLWAAGVRDLRLVDAAITRYARRVPLQASELDRLEGVIPARALTMGAWSYGHRRGRLDAVVEDFEFNRGVAARIAARVRAALGA